MIIRPMVAADADAVLAIYQAGIDTGHATFESQLPSWEKFDTGHTDECRLVGEIDGAVVGFAVLSKVSSRQVYAGVAEISIYLNPDIRGHGHGTALLTAAVEASEEAGYWTLESLIFPENTVSLRLHERCGFKVIGTKPRHGKMTYGEFAGRWRDVLLLSRRSTKTGR
ncbi:MAG: GNAT family N-acetyltransferase [Proteobacteria bacterium]|nr:GNAT family N-acetyltransferase [Pseudomonadota bacterium]